MLVWMVTLQGKLRVMRWKCKLRVKWLHAASGTSVGLGCGGGGYSKDIWSPTSKGWNGCILPVARIVTTYNWNSNSRQIAGVGKTQFSNANEFSEKFQRGRRWSFPYQMQIFLFIKAIFDDAKMREWPKWRCGLALSCFSDCSHQARKSMVRFLLLPLSLQFLSSTAAALSPLQLSNPEQNQMLPSPTFLGSFSEHQHEVFSAPKTSR